MTWDGAFWLVMAVLITMIMSGYGPARPAFAMSQNVYMGLAATSESGSQTTTYTFDNVSFTSAGGTAPPDFTISSSGNAQSVDAGSSVSFALSMTAVGSFNNSISLSVAGLPTGAAPTFNPSQVVGSGGTSLTIATDPSAPGGTYSLTVTAVSGALQHRTGLSLTVNPSSAPAGGITSVAPNSGREGDLVAVTITGENTSFVQGKTQASFGAGTSVGGPTGGFGPVTVTSPTTAVANVQIGAAAALGSRGVTIKTGSSQAALANAFA